MEPKREDRQMVVVGPFSREKGGAGSGASSCRDGKVRISVSEACYAI